MKGQPMKVREFKERAVRHGEIMLIPIDRLPENLDVVEKGKRSGGLRYKREKL
jgi:hypothetical protein